MKIELMDQSVGKFESGSIDHITGAAKQDATAIRSVGYTDLPYGSNITLMALNKTFSMYYYNAGGEFVGSAEHPDAYDPIFSTGVLSDDGVLKSEEILINN